MSRLLLALLSLWVAVAARAADAPEGVTAAGEKFAGPLTSIAADGAWQFGADETARRVAPADLAWWGAFAEPAAGGQIVLADGGLIVADNLRIEKELLRGQSPALGSVPLPLELLAGLILHPPASQAERDQLFFRLAGLEATSDRLLLDNGDQLNGTLLGLEGKSIQLEASGQTTAVDVDKVTAVAFNGTLVRRPRPTSQRMLVGLRDGSRLTAVGLSLAEGKLQLKLAGGAELTAALVDVVALQSLGGRIEYLSDLKPASYRHLPYLQLTWPYANDRSVLGSQLRAGGRLVAKGLGMHSPARITYDLPGEFRRFDAELAIDAETAGRGSVIFRVFVDDGSGAWQERHSSPIVRGGAAPVSISVELAGAKRISLLVDYADRGDELDHADWLNARLVR